MHLPNNGLPVTLQLLDARPPYQLDSTMGVVHADITDGAVVGGELVGPARASTGSGSVLWSVSSSGAGQFWCDQSTDDGATWAHSTGPYPVIAGGAPGVLALQLGNALYRSRFKATDAASRVSIYSQVRSDLVQSA